jgi:hypothetical protein
MAWMNLACALVMTTLVGLSACDTEDPTMVVVDNDFPAAGEAAAPTGGTAVFKVWWVTSLLPDPVAPGGEGLAERTVPATDFAYAVLAPGWDPSSATAPAVLLPAKSSVRLSAARGDTLHVHVSDATFVGDCAAGAPLSQSDADFIAQRIFPGELAGVVYDAATCTATAADEAGPDAEGRDAGAD